MRTDGRPRSSVDVVGGVLGVGIFHPDRDGQARLRGVGILSDRLRGEGVVYDLPGHLQVGVAVDFLKPGLPGDGVEKFVLESLLQGRVDQSRTDRELRDVDSLVDVVVEAEPLNL